jgi:hypothetical protein
MFLFILLTPTVTPFFLIGQFPNTRYELREEYTQTALYHRSMCTKQRNSSANISCYLHICFYYLGNLLRFIKPELGFEKSQFHAYLKALSFSVAYDVGNEAKMGST